MVFSKIDLEEIANIQEGKKENSEKKKNIRLTGKDIGALKAMFLFKGLSTYALAEKYYSTLTYARKRLSELKAEGYISSRGYYKAKKIDNGKKQNSRIVNIYYPTYKGIRAIDENMDPRNVEPDKKYLDVANLVSELYRRIPNLLSRRQTLQRFELSNYQPPICSIPTSPPLILYIIGETRWHEEISRTIGFIKVKPELGRHIIISKDYEYGFLTLPNSYFIHWDHALEVVPNLAKDINYYFKEFQEVIAEQFPGAVFLPYEPPYLRVNTGKKIIYVAELISGSNFLRLHLCKPIQNVYVYAFEKSKKSFSGINLEYGSFAFFSRQEQKLYKAALNPQTGRMRIIDYDFFEGR